MGSISTSRSLWVIGAPSLAFGLFLALTVSNRWDLLLGSYSGTAPFGDSQNLLGASKCLVGNPNWTPASLECEVGDIPYNYPLLPARLLSVLELGPEQLPFFGIVLIALYTIGAIILLAWTLPKNNFHLRAGILTSALFSPPVWLLLERGNYDSLIFFLLTLAAVSLGSRKFLLGGGIIFIAVLLKLFPLGSLICIGLSKYRAFLIPVFALGLSIVLFLQAEELQIVSRNTPRPLETAWGSAVPIGVVLKQFGFPTENFYILLIANLILISLTVLFLLLSLATGSRRYRNRVAETVGQILGTKRAAGLFITGAGSYVSAYALGFNFDYRLVLLVFVVATLLMGKGITLPINQIMLVFCSVVLWTSFLYGQLVQLLIDILMIPFSGFLFHLLVLVMMSFLREGRAKGLGLG